MRYLGTVAIEAPASFVRALLDEDDIESALANVHPGDDDPGLGRPSAAPDAAAESGTSQPAAEPSKSKASAPRSSARKSSTS